jgi:hypothetical protein
MAPSKTSSIADDFRWDESVSVRPPGLRFSPSDHGKADFVASARLTVVLDIAGINRPN